MGEYTGAVLIVSAMILISPLIIGACILIFLRGRKFGTLAGLFTLKPVLATPLWLLVLDTAAPALPDLSQEAMAALSLLPAVILTAIIVLVFRRLYWPGTIIAYVLLAGDVIRWLNTYALTTSITLEMAFLTAFILPSAYAILALVIVLLQKPPAPAAAAAPPAPA